MLMRETHILLPLCPAGGSPGQGDLRATEDWDHGEMEGGGGGGEGEGEDRVEGGMGV